MRRRGSPLGGTIRREFRSRHDGGIGCSHCDCIAERIIINKEKRGTEDPLGKEDLLDSEYLAQEVVRIKIKQGEMIRWHKDKDWWQFDGGGARSRVRVRGKGQFIREGE